MRRGHKRDAVVKEKFWWRKDVSKNSADDYVELTLDEILHGKVIEMMYYYLKEKNRLMYLWD